MYICPNCSAENRAGANFCRECGRRRRSAEASAVIDGDHCPCCAKRIRHSDRFCIHCGEKLADRQSPESKLCLGCNTIVPAIANFCMNCGEYVAQKSTRKVDLAADVFSDDNPEPPRFEA